MAYAFYVSIQGAKQGKFKGEGGGALKFKNKIKGLAFHYEVTAPTDVATGMATGKRQHSPVTLVKEWGASSPQLFEAAISNEVLGVLFEFLQTTADGEEEVTHTVKLTNARIASIKQDVKGFVGEHEAQDLEEIAFVFNAIEMDNLAGGTSATDSWKGTGSKVSRAATGAESGGIWVQEPYGGVVGAEKLSAPRSILSRISPSG